MDFREGQKALAVAAIFDERRLQRRLHARHLGEVDISLERPLGCGLKVKFIDALSVDHDHPGLLRVTGIDKHAFGHSVLRATAARSSARRAQWHRGGDNRFACWWVKAGASPDADRPLQEGDGLWLCLSSQLNFWRETRRVGSSACAGNLQ